jgi:hypothetical protein
MTINLAELLDGVTSDEEAAKIINSHLSSADKIFINEQVEKIKDINSSIDILQNINGKRKTLKKALKAQNNKVSEFVKLENMWIKDCSPLQRAGILFKGNTVLFGERFLGTFLTDFPVSFLSSWSKIYLTMKSSYNVAPLFDESNMNSLDSRFIELGWRVVSHNLVGHPYQATLRFVDNESKTNIEKLNLLILILPILEMRDTIIQEYFSDELELLKKKVIVKLRREFDLYNVPDSWIIETFTTNSN